METHVGAALVEPLVRLLPCPFCGAQVAADDVTLCEEDCCGAQPRWIDCPNEDCGLVLHLGPCPNLEHAAMQWNRRPT